MEYSVKETASVRKLMLLLYGMAAMVVAILIGTISVYAADDDKPDITISASRPDEEWRNEAYEVAITVDTSKAPEGFEIKSVTARFGASGTSKTITDTMTFTVKANGTLYVTVKDADGNSYQEQFAIDYFDLEGPELIGAINEGLLNLQVVDAKSGVNSIIINGYEFADCPEGTLTIRLQQFDASYKQFSIFVTDKLGNYSEEYIIDNPYYQEDAEKEDNNDEDPASYLPINAEGSPITSATGTVTIHATEYGYTNGAGEVLDVSGNHVEDYDGMEFYVIQTPNGKTFYMVIDKANSENNAYLLTEADAADLLNFTGEDGQVLPQNGAVIAGTYQGSGEDGEAEVSKAGAFNSSPTAVGNEEGTEGVEDGTTAKPKNNNMVMIIILVAIGGAAVLFMKMKNKKKKDTEASADAPIPDDEDDEDEVKDED